MEWIKFKENKEGMFIGIVEIDGHIQIDVFFTTINSFNCLQTYRGNDKYAISYKPEYVLNSIPEYPKELINKSEKHKNMMIKEEIKEKINEIKNLQKQINDLKKE